MQSRPSVPLQWFRAPVSAQSFILIMDDLDANNAVHWAVKDIPASTRALDEDASETNMPSGAMELRNSFGASSYSAPCSLNVTHRCRFRLYAMPTTNTDISFISDSQTITASDEVVHQLADQALVVAVAIANVTIPPKFPTPPPPNAATNGCREGSFTRVLGLHVKGCAWSFKSNSVDLETLVPAGNTVVQHEGRAYRAFDFRCARGGAANV